MGRKKRWSCKLVCLLALLCPQFTLLPQLAFAKSPPFQLPRSTDLERVRSAVIKTDEGTIIVELYPEDAPWHVANFKYLADKGYYRNTLFHIYQPGYVVQGGAKSLAGNDSPGYNLPPEFNHRKHQYGTLGMSRRPDEINPGRESHGAQFHIILGPASHMNGNYTIFGQVVAGSEVLRRLKKGSKIRDVIVFIRPANDDGQRDAAPSGSRPLTSNETRSDDSSEAHGEVSYRRAE